MYIKNRETDKRTKRKHMTEKPRQKESDWTLGERSDAGWSSIDVVSPRLSSLSPTTLWAPAKTYTRRQRFTARDHLRVASPLCGCGGRDTGREWVAGLRWGQLDQWRTHLSDVTTVQWCTAEHLQAASQMLLVELLLLSLLYASHAKWHHKWQHVH